MTVESQPAAPTGVPVASDRTVLDTIAHATHRGSGGLPATGWARGSDAEELGRLAPLVTEWRYRAVRDARTLAPRCSRQRGAAMRAGVTELLAGRAPMADFAEAVSWLGSNRTTATAAARLARLVDVLGEVNQAVRDGDPQRAAEWLAVPEALDVLAPAWPVVAVTTTIEAEVDCGPELHRVIRAQFRTVLTPPTPTPAQALLGWLRDSDNRPPGQYRVTLVTEPCPSVNDARARYDYDGTRLTALAPAPPGPVTESWRADGH